VHIGCSGWQYRDWRNGAFYPPKLPQRRWLEHYAGEFDTVEVNSTFYRLPKKDAVARWVEQTPDDFLFTVKASRYLTHMKRLTDMERGVERLYAGIAPLVESPKLGPVLWQLPPNLGFDAGRIADFLALLPRTTAAAAELASHHDERMEGRALTTTEEDRPLRHAMEVRHPSYETPAFTDLLRAHDLYLAPSQDDPCSNALLEALACGLPAAYLQSGGHPELVGDGGVGFDSSEELPEVFAQLHEELEQRRGAIRVPALSEVADRYLEVLRG